MFSHAPIHDSLHSSFLIVHKFNLLAISCNPAFYLTKNVYSWLVASLYRADIYLREIKISFWDKFDSHKNSDYLWLSGVLRDTTNLIRYFCYIGLIRVKMAWIKQEMGYKGRLLAPLQRLDPLNKGDPNQNYWILQLISLINPNPLLLPFSETLSALYSGDSRSKLKEGSLFISFLISEWI